MARAALGPSRDPVLSAGRGLTRNALAIAGTVTDTTDEPGPVHRETASATPSVENETLPVAPFVVSACLAACCSHFCRTCVELGVVRSGSRLPRGSPLLTALLEHQARGARPASHSRQVPVCFENRTQSTVPLAAGHTGASCEHSDRAERLYRPPQWACHQARGSAEAAKMGCTHSKGAGLISGRSTHRLDRGT